MVLKDLDLSEEDTLPDIDGDWIDSVDLTLPGEYLDESMATELLQYLTSYHALTSSYRAARHQGDSAKAESMFQNRTYARNAAALIQHDYPNTKVIADELARSRVNDVRRQRTAALDSA